MELLYYPGCTLAQRAPQLDETARAVMRALGVELKELSDWNCCGAAFPLIQDNLMKLLAPTRVLIQAEKEGGGPLVTICPECYNVLKRTEKFLADNPEAKQKICDFIEEGYEGRTRVVHLLQVLRDEVGFDKIREKVKESPSLKVAPYYGCLVLRPSAEVGIDDPEDPRILEGLLEALGCEVVDFPKRIDCCGSYQALAAGDAALRASGEIVSAAVRLGAEALVLPCPMCHFNLSRASEKLSTEEGLPSVQVLYFTEVLAQALGVEPIPRGVR